MKKVSPQLRYQRAMVAAGRCASCGKLRKRDGWTCADCRARRAAAKKAKRVAVILGRARRGEL